MEKWLHATDVCAMRLFIQALTHCGLMTPYGDEIWVNIGSGNGLLPDGTKPLPEPMLTDHQ